MKVRATRLGYYANIRIKEGQSFRLKDAKHFSEKWQVKLGKKAEVEEIVEHHKPVTIESPLLDEAELEQAEADINSEVI